MSDKAEEWAQQLLNKTEAKKLEWFPADETEFDTFRADIGDGFLFSIQRSATGSDNKVISLQLRKGGSIVFTDKVNNLVSLSRAIVGMVGTPDDRISKFRLFSDLFRAAQKSAMGGEQTIERVQQLLERLG
jgi:hypothetical protein